MEEFEIQIEDNVSDREFKVKALGNQWYEIYNKMHEMVGSIKIDHENHDHCESTGCILDLPVLDAIRKEIFLHKVFTE